MFATYILLPDLKVCKSLIITASMDIVRAVPLGTDNAHSSYVLTSLFVHCVILVNSSGQKCLQLCKYYTTGRKLCHTAVYGGKNIGDIFFEQFDY